MQIANIYLKYDKSLHDLAIYIKSKFNIGDKNPSGIAQYRFGLNVGGGEYYRFELLGLELNLVVNQGEVLEDDYSEYQYYLYINQLLDIEDGIFSGAVHLMEEVLKKQGIITAIELY
jgi:hypothetical protein